MAQIVADLSLLSKKLCAMSPLGAGNPCDIHSARRFCASPPWRGHSLVFVLNTRVCVCISFISGCCPQRTPTAQVLAAAAEQVRQQVLREGQRRRRRHHQRGRQHHPVPEVGDRVLRGPPGPQEGGQRQGFAGQHREEMKKEHDRASL